MALKSTIHKAQLNVADTDRDVYGDFALTIARALAVLSWRSPKSTQL